MCGWLSQFSAWGKIFFSMPPKAKSKRKAMAAAQEQLEAEEEYISAEEAEGLEEGEDDDPPMIRPQGRVKKKSKKRHQNQESQDASQMPRIMVLANRRIF